MASETTSKSSNVFDTSNISMGAVFAAAVFVGTVAIPIPIGIGFLNFGEIIIYTAAFLFGPIVGALAGTGAAVADVTLGYTIFAPVTFFVKSIEGGIVGYISGDSRRSKIIAVAAGAPVMIVGYFLTVAYLQGIPIALVTELPTDIIQAVVGLAIALPLTEALESRLPYISSRQKIPEKGPENQIISAFIRIGFLSILLFWVPVFGAFFAGLIGSRKCDNVINSVIAGFIPAFIAGGALYFVFGTFEVPIIGGLINGYLTILAGISFLILLIGAYIGGKQ